MVILNRRVVGVSEAALDRFVARARRAVGLRGSVTVLVTSNREMRSLNQRFRGTDQATDVLSFPSHFDSPEFAGDIAISAEIASDNACSLGHSPAEEIKVLALHGILHLAGFDHESDRGEMSKLEERVRAKLGLPPALIARSLTRSSKRKVRRTASRKVRR
jgi:probable rRNA maturation factor